MGRKAQKRRVIEMADLCTSELSKMGYIADLRHTSATNIPETIFISFEDMEKYRKLKAEIESKTQAEHHAEAIKRWNNGTDVS